MSVFFLVKYLFMKIRVGKISEKIIVALGSSVFGIYLLEAVLRRETYGVYLTLDTVLPKGVACALWVIVCMLLGTVITLILKKLPVLRKLL